ncbi:ACR COG1678 domain containing protein [Nitzschia inconspicua]|uniref:ACR COG1678 domain containing protein n=1 Tax=Nitzschia inconspicua TaxID=303405 RepID=A0A9K3PXP6_9STRA|nr:ACR COG1678 domain containing protein [Nitzschia inconspicua]
MASHNHPSICLVWAVAIAIFFETTICLSFLYSSRPSVRVRRVPGSIVPSSITPVSTGTTRSTSTTNSFISSSVRLWTSLNDNSSDNNNADDDFNDDDNNDTTLDWRDVRAKLVMQYRHDQQESGTKNAAATTTRTISSYTSDKSNTAATVSWAYEAGDVIETGSLIVSHPCQDFACGGLRQQYFYKSVILVVEHTPAFTKGLILNRPTAHTMKDDHGEDWDVWYGGDVQGIHSKGEESFLCLHRLIGSSKNKDSQLTSELSTPILRDISSIPWEIAKLLVEAGEASKDDFWLCAGYAGWAPGQLQNELERGNWFMVATDIDSIWRMIGQDLTNPAGTDMWVQVMKRIGKESMTTCMPDQKFKDDMLKQWVLERLLQTTTTKKSTPNRSNDHHDAVHNLSPGTLVRASSPILLDEQVFHQSLVLILNNKEDMTTGVVLNRPSSKSVEIAGSRLPLRFGGRFGVEGKGKTQTWLHCNHKQMQKAQVGKPISQDGKETSTFWRCSREDAESALAVGLAKPEDFVVVEGISVWNKNPLENRRNPSPVEIDTCFTKVDEGGISIVWKLLLVQEPLSNKNAAENLEAANAAWMISGDASWMFSGRSKFGYSSDMQTMEQQHVQSLASSALDKWIRLFLMKP